MINFAEEKITILQIHVLPFNRGGGSPSYKLHLEDVETKIGVILPHSLLTIIQTINVS